MLQKLFAIRDSKAECFNQPFVTHTTADAERSFHRLKNDTTSMIHMYPEDYDLYQIGEYDTNTGVIKALDTPFHIAKAATLNS